MKEALFAGPAIVGTWQGEFGEQAWSLLLQPQKAARSATAFGTFREVFGVSLHHKMLRRIRLVPLVLVVGLCSVAGLGPVQAQFVPSTGVENTSNTQTLLDPLSLRAGWWDGLGLGTAEEKAKLAAWRNELNRVDRSSLAQEAGAVLDGIVALIDDWSLPDEDEPAALPGEPTTPRGLVEAVALFHGVERQIKVHAAEQQRLASQISQTDALQNEARNQYLNHSAAQEESRKLQGWHWMRQWLRWKSLDRRKKALEAQTRALSKRRRLLSGYIETPVKELSCDAAERQYWRYEKKRSGSDSGVGPELGDEQSLSELRRSVYLQDQRLSALIAQLSLWVCLSDSDQQAPNAQAPIGPDPKELQAWIEEAQAQIELRRDRLTSGEAQDSGGAARKKEQGLALDLRAIHELGTELRQVQVHLAQYTVLHEGVLLSHGVVWTGVKSGWATFVDGLDTIAHMSLFTVNDYSITPLDFVRFVLILACAWLVSRGLRSVVSRLEVSQGLRSSLVFLLRRLIHYTVIITGLLIALSTMGIDLTKFAIFASAFGVGVGLGLQSLTKNFVAGFVVLFERSLKIGDFIELESGARGSVREINLRGTVITTPDNIDIMIPNSEFVDGKVTNWTMRDKTCRLKIPFSVAYGTPKDKTKAAALAAANSLPFSLLEAPRHPQVWLTEFGNSALCYELIVWVQGDATARPDAVVAAYNWAIETALADVGIEIPFPQQDLHLRSYFGLRGDDALSVLHATRRPQPKSVSNSKKPLDRTTSSQADPLAADANDAAQETLEGMAQVRREQEEADSTPSESGTAPEGSD